MYYCVKLGGVQGEGVDTVGELLANYLHERGFSVYGYRNFTSRIKGGYSSHEVSFSRGRIRAKKQSIDLLVSLDTEAYERDFPFLDERGVAIVEEETAAPANDRLLAIPIRRTAKEGPGDLFKWTVALGAIGSLLDIPAPDWHPILRKAFERKGEIVVEKNFAALELGYDLIEGDPPQKNTFPRVFSFLQPTTHGKSRLLQGSEAIVESALATGCDFAAGYPISPASEVFSLLAREFTPDDRRKAVQTEDEISAVIMAIGASYAGAMPLVATSGPGLSLMIEGIGLASMTRTPLVVIDAQRAGPSTGMPTKQEQSDIALALAGGHGDVKPLVLAPSSIEDIYTDIPRAYYLAELYKSPVIVLTDFALMSARTDVFNSVPLKVDMDSVRGKRSIPGTADKMFHSTGNQQGANSLPTDLPEVRTEYMKRRVETLSQETGAGSFTLLESGKNTLLVAIGSTRGAIEAALPEIENHVSALFLRVLSPLPMSELTRIFDEFKRIIVFDGNATGQLLAHLKANYPSHDRFVSAKRFDGEPFTREDVLAAVKEVSGDV